MISIHVDDRLCTGHGRCYDVSPTVYESDDEGFCAQRGTTFEVSPVDRDPAVAGARACPQAAIGVADV